MATAELVWTRQKFDSPTLRRERIGAINGPRATARGSDGHIARQLNPYRVSVTDHGADPTGVLDSTSAINTAAARREALARGYGVVGVTAIGESRLYFSPGVSKVSDETSRAFNVKRDNAIIHNTDPTKTIHLHPVGSQV